MVCMTSSELAKRWKVNEGTLRNWRYRGTGPKFKRIGCAVRYTLADVKAFEAKGIKKNKPKRRR